MKFEEYQRLAKQTAIYPTVYLKDGTSLSFIYPSLGLNGEVGEVSERVKKILRDQGGKVSDEDREVLTKELGDVLWYVSNICSDLDLKLDDVARGNIDKLFSRMERGKLQGSGDDR